MKAVIIKPEALKDSQFLLGDLPQIQSGCVRLKGPTPHDYYKRERLTGQEENIFCIKFATGRLHNFSPRPWMHACRQTDPKTLHAGNEYLPRWARQYLQLAQAAFAAEVCREIL